LWYKYEIMELKAFVKSVLKDVVEAVDESSRDLPRTMHLAQTSIERTMEFDVAVTAEDSGKDSLGLGVKVLHFVKAGGDTASEFKNSTVSRIKFGISIDTQTKHERAVEDARLDQNRSRNFNLGR